MKRIIILLISINILYPLPLNAATPCQWDSIVKIEGGYLYPKECHIEVGKTLKENDLRKEQNEKLNKSIELKDLAIQKADERADIWQENSYKQYDRLQTQDRLAKYENWILFGGGFFMGIASAYVGGKSMGK